MTRAAVTLGGIALACLLAVPPETRGFTDGKTVTIVVGYKPGGGYDTYARLVARHLPKYLPGRPSVIIQNMPGANSIIAANHLFRVARPDGLTLATFNRSLALAQVTKVPGVQFDLSRFAWLGSLASEVTILAVRADLHHRTVQDLRTAKSPVIIGALGRGSSTYEVPILLKEFLGLNLKLVSGYSSSADVMLAIERKEVDARGGSYSSLLPFIERGLVRPLIRSRGIEPAVAHLPLDEDLAPTETARALFALRSVPEVISRPYVAPPGTPDERVTILRAAFEKAAEDPELLIEARKAKLPVQFTRGEVALGLVRQILSQAPEVVQEMTRHFTFSE